jgi:hypothetical protein
MFIQSQSSSIDFQKNLNKWSTGLALWFFSIWFLLVPYFTCSAASILNIGDGPQDIIAADFNSDGVDDLAIINTQIFGVVQLQIFLNNGQGSFPSNPNQIISVAPATPSFLTVGDFNGNNSLDIAVSLKSQNQVLIYFNDGNGIFNPTPSIINTPSPWDIAIGNFRGQGKRDLAVLSSKAGTVSIYYGMGDGTFEAGPVVTVANTLSGVPSSIAVGDLNQDNLDDFVVGLQSSNQVAVYLNSAGTFNNAGTYDVGRFPAQVTLGDLNKDNILDIAVVNTMSDNISILINNGNGIFQPAVNYPTGNFGPLGVTIGDFNGDGNADLAVINEANSSVSVLLNNGNGTFQTPIIQSTGSAPLAITSGRFIRNANPSFVVASFASGTINTAVTDATTTTLTQSSSTSVSGQPVTFTATVTSAGTPTGTVNFTIDGGAPTAVALTNGVATFTTSSLSFGSHTITATYAGNVTFGPSFASVTHSVNSGASTLTINSSSNPAYAGDPVTFTATVSGPAGAPAPTGTVTFSIDGQVFATVNLVNGQASINKSFAEGTYNITASYSGDSVYSPSSGSFTQFIIRRLFPFVLPPINVEGFQKVQHKHGKKRVVNVLTWNAPVGGNPPIAYEIFADKNLTKRIGTVSGDQFKFKIYPRRKKRVYTYFIVSVDAFGQRSDPVRVKVQSR